MLKVSLLGQFEVQKDGVLLSIPSRPAQSLLAYLLLTAGIDHRREKLAGLLWPDSSEENARNNLRTALWRLRKALGSDDNERPYLLADDLSITFNRQSGYWLDTSVLECGASPKATTEDLHNFLSHYRGELLPGFYEDWVVLERGRLQAVFEQEVQRLLDHLIAERRWAEVLDWGERWIAFGQTPEPAYRALMVAHGSLGNVSQVASVYERCVCAMRNDLGVEPSEQTRALFERLSKGERTYEVSLSSKASPSTQETITPPETRDEPVSGPSRTSLARSRNLPIPLTSFIGREREIEQVKRLLSTTRLVTLIGSGGVGKTRLAIQLARELLSEYKDGVGWVDLVALTDPALVPQAVAQALRLREVLNEPLIETLANALRARQVMVLLDNCEHLVDACAQMAESLLGQCASLTILATSREALGLSGETTWPVPSLSLPESEHEPSIDKLAQYESIRLFVERARAVNPDFALTDQNALPIIQICRRLDGVPLALELAAVRVKTLSVQQIAARLDDRFNLLTHGSRTALPRHQTLRALIDWSYDLLSLPERVLWRRLSVFIGGWTLEAAESVCAGDGLERGQVLELLSRLVDKSLVMVTEQDGAARYRMLETIRQYGQDKLLTLGELHRLRELHLDYFLKFAEDAEPKINRLHDRGWLARVEAEHDNFRSALEWGSRNNPSAALKIVTGLTVFWITRGHAAEGRRWASEALIASDQFPVIDEEGNRQIAVRANALQALARIIYSQGDNAHAIVYSEQAAAVARQLGDKALLAAALGQELLGRTFLADMTGTGELATECLAIARQSGDKSAIGLAQAMLGQVLALRSHDFEVGRKDAEQGISFLKEGGNPWLAAMTILSLGMAAKFLGNYGEARLRFLDSLPMFREMGDKHRINIIYSELAHIKRYEGQYANAELLYRETILQWQTLGHRGAVANQLECFAYIAKAREQVERAVRLLGTAQVLREKIDMPMSSAEQVEYDREVADLRAHTDEKFFAAAWGEGRAMSMEQAIAYALENKPSG